MKTFCNPVNMIYRFLRSERKAVQPCREGSDPALVYWRGRYILATSKTSGIHWSDDLATWHFVPSALLPSEGYGPDLWVKDDDLYYVNGAPDGVVFRAVDPERDRWEAVGKIGYRPDPKIFVDRDDRIYLYYGSAVNRPLNAVELRTTDFTPCGPVVSLNAPDAARHGWERSGENNQFSDHALDVLGIRHPDLPDYRLESYNEGAWLTEHNGKYYLQNSLPATEFNIYCDAISVGDTPLGPFVFQPDNPLSLKPGGFITGAGHSCTFTDRYDNYFHVSTMRISRHHIYERRIGLFPAGFHADGTMFCHTRFGDWPHFVPERKLAAAEDTFTGWVLLSYGAAVEASSFEPGHEPELAVNENIRDYWAAVTSDPAPALTLALGFRAEIRALQLDIAEHGCRACSDGNPDGCARFVVESSDDGNEWHTLWDMGANIEDKTHFYRAAAPVRASWLRLRILSIANGGTAALSGVRVFGSAPLPVPSVPAGIKIQRRKNDPTIADIAWAMPDGAIGVNALWGLLPDRLHHCWQTLGVESLVLPSLDAGLEYFVALEAFGPGGIAPISEPVKI